MKPRAGEGPDTIIRADHRQQFVVLDQNAVDDERLSARALAFLTYLLSKPSTWQVRPADLERRFHIGRDAAYAGLRELREAGYAERRPIREGRRIVRWEMVIYEFSKPLLTSFPEVEEPDPANPDTPFQDPGCQDPDFPHSSKERRTLVNTEETLVNTEKEPKTLAPQGKMDDPFQPSLDPQEPTPKPPAKRKADPLFDSLVEALGVDPKELTAAARSRINVALRDLREVSATPEQVKARAQRYRDTYPTMSLTPTALAKHWPALNGSQPKPPSKHYSNAEVWGAVSDEPREGETVWSNRTNR